MLISEMESLFQNHLATLTGIPGDRVRGTNAYNGQPKFEKNLNYIYFYLQPVDDRISHQVDTELEKVDDEKANKLITYNRVIELDITVYGPLCTEYTRIIKLGVLDKDRNKSLRQNKIYPVTDIAEGTRVWEIYNNNWIQRSDLQIRFNTLADNTGITVREPIYYVQGADLVLKTESQEREINIVEEE